MDQARARFRLHRALITLVAALVACTGRTRDAEPADAQDAGAPVAARASVSPAEVEQLGVRNVANPAPRLITAAQVTEDQLDALVGLGYERFISLRVPTEEGAGWEEAHLEGSDVSFTRIPVPGAEGLTRANVETLDHLLDDAADEGTVLYCASSNRVGALLALRAYWLDGAEAEEALTFGRAAGMKGLEGAVTELVSQPR